VSFSDAVVKIQDPEKEKKNKVVLGEPKPSSYMDYLEQSGGITTYNDQDFVLRGVKQYWLRKDIVQGIPIKNEKVGSVIKGLSAGNIFYGRIRFQNLKKTELGLLLWCLRLEKDSQINIGKAKAYGYGRCSITDISLRILDNEKAYALNGMLDLNPFKIDDNIDKYIDAYKEKMSGILGAKIQDIESVKTFFLMKNAKNMPDKDKIRYMSIDKKEYQNRKAALQKPGELVTNSKND
jgi:CRISPR-associated protein (TIGR03986 family)